ncbi:MAG: ferrous iron transporter B [Pseudomonadales bacterium]|jgi:ferrous iron transport protein B|nr:ferrous iron transporter B [Pseudomonadales bacterium]
MSSALLIGSPNSGKSLLFNRLTGLHQKVANFPGITVEVGSGSMLGRPELTLVDFPGTYSLLPISGEERIASDGFHQALRDPELDAVLCIVDATRLEKSLHFALQVIRECQRAGKPVFLLANMADVLRRHGLAFDADGLAHRLGIPVIAVSARSGEGLEALRASLDAPSERGTPFVPRLKDLSDEQLSAEAAELAREFSGDTDVLIRSHARLDGFFLHSFFGGIAFFAIMYLLFQSIFTWAAPVMDAVEGGIGLAADAVVPLLPSQTLRDFTADALFGGIGAFLVFVPQIFVLTVVVGIMEDSGYMARAALICHRPLRFFGLSGKSFVPMLSGVACAIPGIYAARTVDSPRRRLLTYLAVPLMPCSARLPVYTVLIAAFIPAQTALGGLVGLQGLAMFLIYFFGMVVGLLVTALVSRTRVRADDDLPFVLEMPPYRLPSWRPLLRNAWNRSRHFVTKAGVVIFAVTVTVWVLGYFPNFGADLGASWLGALGRVIEPVFEPIGLDWRYGVAILSSFLAREVFVGTLGAIFGIEGAEEDFVPLVEKLQASGLSVASGFALLVFYAIALQCVSTLALLARETRSVRLPAQLFLAYGLLAYVLAFVTYRLVGALAG